LSLEALERRRTLPAPLKLGESLPPKAATKEHAVNEIIAADKLLPRAREIAEGLAQLPPLTAAPSIPLGKSYAPC
jgi:hypothetical protein